MSNGSNLYQAGYNNMEGSILVGRLRRFRRFFTKQADPKPQFEQTTYNKRDIADTGVSSKIKRQSNHQDDECNHMILHMPFTPVPNLLVLYAEQIIPSAAKFANLPITGFVECLTANVRCNTVTPIDALRLGLTAKVKKALHLKVVCIAIAFCGFLNISLSNNADHTSNGRDRAVTEAVGV